MINKPKTFRHYKDSILFIGLGIAKIGDTKTINKTVFYPLDTFYFSY